MVLKGLVDFAFVLLSIERKTGIESHLFWNLGHMILHKIISKNSEAGDTVLKIVIDKIKHAGTNVNQYTGTFFFI